MEKLILETVQHSRLTHIDKVAPINDQDYEVLTEIRDVLIKHDYVDRFGVTLLHKHFDIAEDEMLMENTNEEDRISTITVEKADGTEQNSIETLWKFHKDITAGTRCVLRCHYFLGHKQRHVREKI